MGSWKKAALPLALLGAGVAGFLLLLWGRKPPVREERAHLGPLVEAVSLPAQSLNLVVSGQGTAQPGAQVDLVPQVAGVVVWKSPSLETGAFFGEGEVLLRIDPEDYKLAVAQAEARVAQTRLRLDVAAQEAELARQEWDRVGAQGEATPLALQEPQMRAARAEYEAAQATLAEARLRLGRTELSAPFRGRVQSSSVDRGQFVAPGRPLARLYSVERTDVAVPLSDEDLAWFSIADGKAGEGAAAVVTGRFAGGTHTWRGTVVRSAAELDPRSRMAQVIVSVSDPYQDPSAPLLPGMFVDVDILGRKVEGVRVIPRTALRAGDVVWSAGSDGVLRIRKVEVLRATREAAVGRVDLAEDERVVTSHLSEVTDGMRVRTVEASRP